MYQELWIVFAFEFCILLASKDQKERTASLIVLPPLVLGYDELYEDKSTEKNKPNNKNTAKTPPKQTKTTTKQGKTTTKQGKTTTKPGGNKGKDKDGKAKPKARSEVKFDREGHVLNFAGHFMLPHDDNDCPFHDDLHHKLESLNLTVNRRSLGNRIIRRNLRNIVKNNVLKNLVNQRRNTVDKNGNLVVKGNVAFGGPIVLNKGDAKKKNVGQGKPMGAIASNITEELIKELAAGMLGGILLNH